MFGRSVTALCLFLALAGCSGEPVFEYDSRPINLQRAPAEPGGPALGATLARVEVGADTPSLAIDTGSLLSSLSRGACLSSTPEPVAYEGDIQLLGAGAGPAPLRASFRDVTLFDLCAGAVGDVNTQVAGVLGGDILHNFSLAFALPRAPDQPATMTIYSSLPASDSDLAANGYAVMKFNLRGGTAAATVSGSGRPGPPSSRVMIRACGNPPA